MKRILAVIAVPLALAACADERLTPAPGAAPGWPGLTPPQPSYAPLPFTDTYLPTTAVQTMPAVPPGQNVPYAVPPGAGPVAAVPVVAPVPVTSAEASALSPCHKVPPINFEGRQASTVCQQPDGGWVYIPD